ncbi:hypothetical protein AB0M22_05450 [Nocardia sp. NPDC051756]|uniref:hypothetical protein n=1 Tax=Nocardia sp. NPDC051756 TaxID=3154751 RepID=UPI00343B9E30
MGAKREYILPDVSLDAALFAKWDMEAKCERARRDVPVEVIGGDWTHFGGSIPQQSAFGLIALPSRIRRSTIAKRDMAEAKRE